MSQVGQPQQFQAPVVPNLPQRIPSRRTDANRVSVIASRVDSPLRNVAFDQFCGMDRETDILADDDG